MNSIKTLSHLTERLSVLVTALSDMPKDYPQRRSMVMDKRLAEIQIAKIQRYLDLQENAGLG